MSIVSDSRRLRITNKIRKDTQVSGGQRVGFPYNTPTKTQTGPNTGMFQDTISDSDLDETFERNAYARKLVNSPVNDAFKNKVQFTPMDISKLDTDPIMFSKGIMELLTQLDFDAFN